MSNHLYTTITCGDCGHLLKVPVYCKNRFCPVCAAPRSRRLRKKLQWYVSNVKLRPGERFKHLVLTVRNSGDLAAAIDHLVQSFRRLRQRAWWKSHVSGGAYVIEITGQAGNYHPHIHCLLTSYFAPFRVLKAHWEECSGSWGVHISEKPAHSVANYLTDYITKLPADVVDSVPMNEALRRRRLYSVFGSWHALKCPAFKMSYPCPSCGASCWYRIEALCRRDHGKDPPPKIMNLLDTRAVARIQVYRVHEGGPYNQII